MKGVILAGGTGSRLYPLTKVTNKHLLPIYDKPMIHYPLNTLINAGIDEILIVAGKGHAGHFLELLQSGEHFGAELSYAVQEEPKGIAHALLLAKRFADNENIVTILGDNIFEQSFRQDIRDFTDKQGAKIFLKEVQDASRFGVAELDDNDKLTNIVEKPAKPSTNYAVTGLYLYDSQVFDIIEDISPSNRGELEISDVNNKYIRQKEMNYRIIRGFWSDMGTYESLYKSTVFVRNNVIKNNAHKR